MKRKKATVLVNIFGFSEEQRKAMIPHSLYANSCRLSIFSHKPLPFTADLVQLPCFAGFRTSGGGSGQGCREATEGVQCALSLRFSSYPFRRCAAPPPQSGGGREFATAAVNSNVGAISRQAGRGRLRHDPAGGDRRSAAPLCR